jgi:hypothetical protein
VTVNDGSRRHAQEEIMISDVLADAVIDIQQYLEDMPAIYADAHPRILALIEQMKAMRI